MLAGECHSVTCQPQPEHWHASSTTAAFAVYTDLEHPTRPTSTHIVVTASKVLSVRWTRVDSRGRQHATARNREERENAEQHPNFENAAATTWGGGTGNNKPRTDCAKCACAVNGVKSRRSLENHWHRWCKLVRAARKLGHFVQTMLAIVRSSWAQWCDILTL